MLPSVEVDAADGCCVAQRRVPRPISAALYSSNSNVNRALNAGSFRRATVTFLHTCTAAKVCGEQIQYWRGQLPRRGVHCDTLATQTVVDYVNARYPGVRRTMRPSNHQGLDEQV